MMISAILVFSALIIGVMLWWLERRLSMQWVANIVGVLVVAAFGAWLLPPLAIPADRSVGWELASGFGGPGFDRATAQTTTVVPVMVTWPGCEHEDWLAAPAIVYTPWSVTITMSTNDAFAAKRGSIGSCLSDKYVRVNLSEPLGGRAMFDGSSFPADARS